MLQVKIVILTLSVNGILFLNKNNIKHFNEVQNKNSSLSSNPTFKRVKPMQSLPFPFFLEIKTREL